MPWLSPGPARLGGRDCDLPAPEAAHAAPHRPQVLRFEPDREPGHEEEKQRSKFRDVKRPLRADKNAEDAKADGDSGEKVTEPGAEAVAPAAGRRD